MGLEVSVIRGSVDFSGKAMDVRMAWRVYLGMILDQQEGRSFK